MIGLCIDNYSELLDVADYGGLVDMCFVGIWSYCKVEKFRLVEV